MMSVVGSDAPPIAMVVIVAACLVKPSIKCWSAAVSSIRLFFGVLIPMVCTCSFLSVWIVMRRRCVAPCRASTSHQTEPGEDPDRAKDWCDSVGIEPGARRKRGLIAAMTGDRARDARTWLAPSRPIARAITDHRGRHDGPSRAPCSHMARAMTNHRERHGDSWPARWPRMGRAMATHGARDGRS
jgi:hypothetical protein